MILRCFYRIIPRISGIGVDSASAECTATTSRRWMDELLFIIRKIEVPGKQSDWRKGSVQPSVCSSFHLSDAAVRSNVHTSVPLVRKFPRYTHSQLMTVSFRVVVWCVFITEKKIIRVSRSGRTVHECVPLVVLPQLNHKKSQISTFQGELGVRVHYFFSK